jgi:hypothetical protein
LKRCLGRCVEPARWVALLPSVKSSGKVGKAKRAHLSGGNLGETVGTLRFAHPTDFLLGES